MLGFSPKAKMHKDNCLVRSYNNQIINTLFENSLHQTYEDALKIVYKITAVKWTAEVTTSAKKGRHKCADHRVCTFEIP